MIRPVKWMFTAVFCMALSVYTNAQTQPAGQVSRKAGHWYSSKSITVSAPTANDCSAILPKPGTSPATTPGTANATTPPKLGANEILIRQQVADNADKQADAFAKSAPGAVTSAVNSKIAADSVDDASKVSNPAKLADMVVAWAAVAHDCSSKVQPAAAPSDAIVIAYSSAAVAAYDNTANANRMMLKALNGIADKCEQTLDPIKNTPVKDSSGDQEYTYNRFWFPLLGKGCISEAQLYYFQVRRTASVASQAQYLYNAEQSTNQINADLLTTTFSPGFQAVLAGTATQGSS